MKFRTLLLIYLLRKEQHEKPKRLGRLPLIVLSLSACNVTRQPQQDFNILELGRPVPLITNQALSIGHRLEWGLSTQAVGESHLYSIETNDLKGYPFVTIVVTAPVQHDDVWQLAASVRGDEWNPLDESSPWTTTLTGASTVRDTLIVTNVGLSVPMKIYKTVQALGGLSNLKEVVAVDLQTFVVRDVQGTLWNLETQKPLTAEELKRVNKIYTQIYNANNTPQTAELMETQWEEFLDGHDEEEYFDDTQDPELSPQSFGLADLAAPDGTLDVKKTATYLRGTEDALNPQIVHPPTRSCILFVCQGIRSGTLPMNQNVRLGAYVQAPYLFGRAGNFNFIGCIDNNTSADVKVPYLGCAPTAFVGLIQWCATYKNLRLFSSTSPSTIAYKMTAPLGLRGRPLIANYMGSCWNGGGVQTVGWGFRDGANNFLRNHGSALRVTSNISHGPGNVTSAPAKANILINFVGISNKPVIAEYFTGLLQGHFSPVVDYAVYDSGSNGLNIRTVGDVSGVNPSGKPDYTWYSLSGAWGTERDVFAVE